MNAYVELGLGEIELCSVSDGGRLARRTVRSDVHGLAVMVGDIKSLVRGVASSNPAAHQVHTILLQATRRIASRLVAVGIVCGCDIRQGPLPRCLCGVM